MGVTVKSFNLLNFIEIAVLSGIFLSSQALAHPGGHERIMSLNEQIKHDPKNPYLLIKRAQEHIQEDKEYAVAKVDLDKAQTLGATRETSAEFNFVMGLYHQYQSQYSKAVPFFTQCINLEIDHLQCHRALAETALAQGDPKQAITIFTQFIKSSTSPQTDDYFHLAQLLEKDGQFHKALMYLDQAQVKFGVLPHFEKYAIEIETHQKNFQKALQRHQKLKPYFGKTPQWQFKHGVLLQNLGKTDQAKTMFEQALATLTSQKKKKNKASETLQQEINAKLASLAE